MKIKAIIATLAAALTATLAQATPVSVSASGLNSLNFSSSNQFTVTADQLYSGVLTTLSIDTDVLSISSVTLSKGSESYVFDLTDDAYKFLSVTSTPTTEVIKGKSFAATSTSYVLSDVLLSAGTWTLTVQGSDSLDKYTASYTAQLNAVPEPQSLALVLAGLGVAGLVRRRQAR